MARYAKWALALLLAVGANAAWENINPNAMTILFGASAPGPDANTVFVSGGDNGGGAAILKSTDGGYNLDNLPHDRQMMYLSVDIAKNDVSGSAGSLGFYGQTAPGSYTNDGENFIAFGDNVVFSAAQSCVAVGNDTAFLVGAFLYAPINSSVINGIAYTNDAGRTFNTKSWHMPDNSPRYGAISNNAWILTGGFWGSSEEKTDNYYAFSQNWGVKYGDEKTKSLELVNRMREVRELKNANGYWGNIAVSTDNGDTWTQVFEDYERFYFNGVNCYENHCWAVAEGPAGAFIYESTDGGFNWSLNIELPGDSLLDIEFLSATEGWAVGGIIKENTFDALFLHTLDGGATWTREATIPNAYPNGISTTTSGVAYASAFMRNGLSSLLAYTP